MGDDKVMGIAGAPPGDGKPSNIRWSRYVDAPVWPWSVGGWLLAALFILLFALAAARL